MNLRKPWRIRGSRLAELVHRSSHRKEGYYKDWLGCQIPYCRPNGNRTGVPPDERCKGYVTEAASIIADYPLPIDNVVRVQADTNTEFEASQRVPERVGFRKEGIIRRHFFTRGK